MYEDETVRLAAEGDQEAFETLVNKYQNMVYNFAFQSLRSKDDAFDVSQDVFIKVFRALPDFRGGCKFSTWLYRIVKNTVYDYIRSRSRRVSTVLFTEYNGDDGNDGAGQIDSPDPDLSGNPEAAYESKARGEAVNEAIHALSETHREIIVMRDINGCSYEEIAEQLELEIGTVKSRINRARVAVKNYLVERNIL